MKLKTVPVRRSRPSALSLALALMITMIFVYAASLPPKAETADAASGDAMGTAEVRMEGLEAAFLCEGSYETQLEARIHAAMCAGGGGAGLILSENGRYAVISRAVSPDAAPENALVRSAGGLTLKISGPAGQIAAVSDAAAFLRAQAAETGGLAGALEKGDTDLNSLCALLSVYRTQGQRALAALQEIENPDRISARLIAAAESALSRIESALAEPDAGKIKLIHAAACGEWISMLNDFSGGSI